MPLPPFRDVPAGGLSRRALIGAATAGAAALGTGALATAPAPGGRPRIWLNNSAINLLPRAALAAATQYLEWKTTNTFPKGYHIFDQIEPARVLFARLINADPAEIAIVPSTMAGENLIVNGMDLPTSRGNIVTDALHYDGSLFLYQSIRNADLALRVVPPRGYGIDLADMAAAIDHDTRLVAISHVSSHNGFAHDLERLCAIAHAKGVPVYADIVQSAGVVPIDVKRSNVDFAACGSYKWLMGEMGAGFLYCRKEHLGHLIKRRVFSYMQTPVLEQHPFSPVRGPTWPLDYAAGDAAAHYFEVGTPAITALLTLQQTLPAIMDIGVEAIAAHIAPMIERLRTALPALGYESLTPAHNRSPATLFRVADSKRLAAHLEAANIVVGMRETEVRISPALHNTPDDIEALIAVMARAGA